MVNICRVCIRHIGPDREPAQPLSKYKAFGWNLITAQILACFPDLNLKITVRNPLVVCVECSRVIGAFSLLRFRVQEAQKVLEAFLDFNRQCLEQTGMSKIGGRHGLDLVAVAAMCDSVIKAKPIVVQSDRFVQLVGTKQVIIRNKKDENSIAPSSNQPVSNNPQSARITGNVNKRIREPETKLPNTSSDVTPIEIGSNLPKTPTVAQKIKTKKQPITETSTKSNVAISKSTIPICSAEGSIMRLLRNTVQDQDKTPIQTPKPESVAAMCEPTDDSILEPIYIYGKPGPKFTKLRATERLMKSSAALHMPDQSKQKVNETATELQLETENLFMPNPVTRNSIELPAEVADENVSKEAFSSPARLSDNYDSQFMDHSPIHDSSPELLEIYKEIPYKEPSFGGRRKKSRTNRLFFKFPKKKVTLKMPLITSVVSLSGVFENDVLPQEQAGNNTTIHVQDEASSFSNDSAVVQSVDPLVETIANLANVSFEATNSEQNDVPRDRRGTHRVRKNLVAQEVQLSQEIQKDLTELISCVIEDSSVDNPAPSTSDANEVEAPIIDLRTSENIDNTSTSLNDSIISKEAHADTSFKKKSRTTTPTICRSYENVTTRYGRRIKPRESYSSFPKRRKLLTRAAKPADCIVSPEGVSLPVRITFEGQKSFLERLKLKLVSPKQTSKALALNLQKEIEEHTINTSGATEIASIAKVPAAIDSKMTADTTIKNPPLPEAPSFTVHPIVNDTAHMKNVRTKGNPNMSIETHPTIDEIRCINKEALKEDNNKCSTIIQQGSSLILEPVLKEDDVQTNKFRLPPFELHHKDAKNTLEQSVNEDTYKTQRVQSKSIPLALTGSTPKTRANNSNAELLALPVNESKFKTRRARAKSVSRLDLTKGATTSVCSSTVSSPALSLERMDNEDVSKSRRAKAKFVVPLDNKGIRVTRASRSMADLSALLLEKPINEEHFKTRRVRAKSVSRFNVNKAKLITAASNLKAEIPAPTLEQPQDEEDSKSRLLRSKSVTRLNVRKTALTATASKSAVEVPPLTLEQSAIENYSNIRMVRAKSVTRLDVKKAAMMTSTSNSATLEVTPPTLEQSVKEDEIIRRKVRAKSITSLVNKATLITSENNLNAEILPPTLEQPDIQSHIKTRMVKTKSLTHLNSNKAATSNSVAEVSTETLKQPFNETVTNTRKVRAKSVARLNVNKAALIITASNSTAEVTAPSLEQAVNESNINTRRVRVKSVTTLNVNKEAMITAASNSVAVVTPPTPEQPVNEAETNTKRVRSKSVTRINVNKAAPIIAGHKSAAEIIAPTLEQPNNETDNNTRMVRAKSITRLNINKDATTTAANNSAVATLQQSDNKANSNYRKIRAKSVSRLSVARLHQTNSSAEVITPNLEQSLNEADNNTKRIRTKSVSRLNVNKATPKITANVSGAEVTAPTLGQPDNEADTNTRRVRLTSVIPFIVNKEAMFTAVSNSAAEVTPPSSEQPVKEAGPNTRRVRAKSVTGINVNKDAPITVANKLTAEVTASTVEQSVTRFNVNKDAPIVVTSNLAAEVIAPTLEQPDNEADTKIRRVRTKSVTRLNVNKVTSKTTPSKSVIEVTAPTTNKLAISSRKIRSKSSALFDVINDTLITAANRRSCSTAEISFPTVEKSIYNDTSKPRRARAKSFTSFDVLNDIPSGAANRLTAEVPNPTVEQFVRQDNPKIKKNRTEVVTLLEKNNDLRLSVPNCLTIPVTCPIEKQTVTEDKTLTPKKFRAIPTEPIDVNKIPMTTATSNLTKGPNVDQLVKENNCSNRKNSVKSSTPLDVYKDSSTTPGSSSIVEVTAPSLDQIVKEKCSTARIVDIKSVKPLDVNKGVSPNTTSRSAAKISTTAVEQIVKVDISKIRKVESKSVAVTQLDISKDSQKNPQVSTPTVDEVVREDTFKARKFDCNSIAPLDVNNYSSKTEDRNSIVDISTSSSEQIANRDTSKAREIKVKSVSPLDGSKDLLTTIGSSSIAKVPTPTQVVREDICNARKVRAKLVAFPGVNKDLPKTIANSSTAEDSTPSAEQETEEYASKNLKVRVAVLDVNKDLPKYKTTNSIGEVSTRSVKEEAKDDTSKNRKVTTKSVSSPDVNKHLLASIRSSSGGKVPTPTVDQVVKDDTYKVKKSSTKSVSPSNVNKDLLGNIGNSSSNKVPMETIEQVDNEHNSKNRKEHSKTTPATAPDVNKDLPKAIVSSSTVKLSTPSMEQETKEDISKAKKVRTKSFGPDLNKDLQTTVANSSFNEVSAPAVQVVKEDISKNKKVRAKSVAPLNINKNVASGLYTKGPTASVEQVVKEDIFKTRKVKPKLSMPLDPNKDLPKTVTCSSNVEVLTSGMEQEAKDCTFKHREAKPIAPLAVDKDLPEIIASSSLAKDSTSSMEQETKDITKNRKVTPKPVALLDINKDFPITIASSSTADVSTPSMEQETKEDTSKNIKVKPKSVAPLDLSKASTPTTASISSSEIPRTAVEVVNEDNAKTRKIKNKPFQPSQATNQPNQQTFLDVHKDLLTSVASNSLSEIPTQTVEHVVKEDNSKNINVKTKLVSLVAVNKDKLTTVATSSSTEDPTLTVGQTIKEDNSKAKEVTAISVKPFDILKDLPKMLAGGSTAEIRKPTVEHLFKEDSSEIQKVKAKSVPTLDVNKDLCTTIESSSRMDEVKTPTVEQVIKSDKSKSRNVRTKSVASLDVNKDIPTTAAISSSTVSPTQTIDQVAKEDISNVINFRAKLVTPLDVHKDLSETVASSSTVEVPTKTFDHVEKEGCFETRKVRAKSVAPPDAHKDLPTSSVIAAPMRTVEQIAQEDNAKAEKLVTESVMPIHAHKDLLKTMTSNPTAEVPVPTVEHIFKEDRPKNRAKSVAPLGVNKGSPITVASNSSTEFQRSTVEQVDNEHNCKARKVRTKPVIPLDVHQDLPKAIASNLTVEVPILAVEHSVNEDSCTNRNVRVTPPNVNKGSQITTESSSTAEVQNPTVQKIVEDDNSGIRKVKTVLVEPRNTRKNLTKTTGSSTTLPVLQEDTSKTRKVSVKSDALLDAYKCLQKTAQNCPPAEVPPPLVEQLVKDANEDIPLNAKGSPTGAIPMVKENKTETKKVVAKSAMPLGSYQDSSVTTVSSSTTVVSSRTLEPTVKEEDTKTGLIRGKFIVPLYVDKDTSTNADRSMNAEVAAQILEQSIKEDKSKSSETTPISIASMIEVSSSIGDEGIFEDCVRSKDKKYKPVEIKVSYLSFDTSSDVNAATLAAMTSARTDSSNTRNMQDKLNNSQKSINEETKSNESTMDVPVPELVSTLSEVPTISLSPEKVECKNESPLSSNLKEVEKQIAIKCAKEIAIVISPAEQSLARAKLITASKNTAETYFKASKEVNKPNERIDVETSKSDLPGEFGKPTPELLGGEIAKLNTSDQFDKSKEDVNENLISELEDFECDRTRVTKKASSDGVQLFQNEMDGISKLPSTLVGSEIVPVYCNSIYLEDISNDGSDSTEIKQDDIGLYNISRVAIDNPVVLSEPNVISTTGNTESPTTTSNLSVGCDNTLPDDLEHAKKSIEVNQEFIEPTPFQNKEGTAELFLQATTFLKDTITFETNKQLHDETRNDAIRLSQGENKLEELHQESEIVCPIQAVSTDICIRKIHPKGIATPEAKEEPPTKRTAEMCAGCDDTSEITTVETESIISSENQATFTQLSMQTAASIADRIPAILAKPEVTQDDIESVISSLVKGSSNTICVQETPCANIHVGAPASLESVKTLIVPEILTNDLDDNIVSRQDVANYIISSLVQVPNASKDGDHTKINSRLCDSEEIVEAEEGSPLIFEDPVMPRASDIFDSALSKAPSKHPVRRKRKNSDSNTHSISQPFDLPKTKVRRVSSRSKEPKPAKNDKLIRQNIPKQSRRRTCKSSSVMQQLSPFTDSSQDHTPSSSTMSTPDAVNTRDCFLESVGKSPNEPPAAVMAALDATAIGISQTLKEFWAEFNTSLESPGKSSQDQFIDSMCLPEVFAEVTLPYLDAEQDLCVGGSNLEDITPTLIAEPKDLGCITSTAQAYLGIRENPQQVMINVPSQYDNVDTASYEQLDNFNIEDILRNKIECTPTDITSEDNTTSEFIANILPDNNETCTSTDYLPETDQNLKESGTSKALPKPIPVLLSISGKSGRQSIKIMKVSNTIENSSLQEKILVNPDTAAHSVTPPKVTSNEDVFTDTPKQALDQNVSPFQLQNTSLSPKSSLMLLMKPGDLLDSSKNTLINQQPVTSYNDKSKGVLLSRASKVLLSPEYKADDISTPLILVTFPASTPAQGNSSPISSKTIAESLPLNTFAVPSATCTQPITNSPQLEEGLDRKVSMETKIAKPKSTISAAKLNHEKTAQKRIPKPSVNRGYVRKRMSKLSVQPLIDPPKNSSDTIVPADDIKNDHSKDFLMEYSKDLLNDTSKHDSTNQVPKKAKPKPLTSFTSVIVSPPATEASPMTQVISAKQKLSPFKKYSCEICRFDFALESSLSKHKEWHRKWGGLYQCKYCVERYDNLEQLNKHTAIHGQIHQCANCCRRFRNTKFLSDHMQSQHGISPSNEPEVLCPDCGRLITVSVLPFHLDWHDPDAPVQCAICTVFTLRMDRHMHWNNHHHNGKQFVCAICGESYSTKQTLCWHLESHSSNCRLCGRDMKKIEFGEEHTCPKNILRPYKRRKQQKMLASLRNKRALKCKSCPKAYYSRDLLRKHAYRMHKECDQCGQVCFSEIVLQAHKIKVHNIDINAQFALCTRSYKSNNEIIEEAERFMSRVSRQHLKPTLPRSTLSKRAKKITCDLCGHVCQSYASLSAHRRYHRKQRINRGKQHQEDKSGIVFGSKSSRSGHMAIHTYFSKKFNIIRRSPGISISPPKQQQTSRGFTFSHKLSQEKPLLTSDDSHIPMLIGGLNVQKADISATLPYICQICDKSFKSSKQLSMHINIHGSVKRFNCSHCEKHFFTIDLLKEHESRFHRGTAQPSSPQQRTATAPPPPVVPPSKATTSNQYKAAAEPPATPPTAVGSRSPRRTHACHCGEQFLSLATLRKHKVLKHPNKGSAAQDTHHKAHTIAGDALFGERNTASDQ